MLDLESTTKANTSLLLEFMQTVSNEDTGSEGYDVNYYTGTQSPSNTLMHSKTNFSPVTLMLIYFTRSCKSAFFIKKKLTTK